MKITDIQLDDPTIYVGILTENQKNQLINQQYSPDSYFNPIQDANGNWIISIKEMQNCIPPEFLWVKDLDMIEYIKPPYNLPFNLND
jgi:hypothetical protein